MCVELLKKLLKLGIALFLCGVFSLIGLYLYIRPSLPDINTLKDVRLQTPMRVYSADGQLVSQFGEKRRIPLTLDEMPDTLVNAYLAVEDSRFYEHPGVDIIGVMRAAVAVISSGSRSQGASTITMQLARNFFLTREKTIIRKVKEVFIALHIESLLTKDEIIELYLNKIELGNRSFGVGAAAQVYYGKSVTELTLPQMAMLAGLPKAPSTLNPIRNPERAKHRRAVVLGRMLATTMITRQEFDEARNAPITAEYHGAQITAHAPYVAEMARKEMVERFGEEEAYTGGYDVFLTVSAKQQKAAQRAVIENLHNYDTRHGYRGPKKVLWKADIQQDDLLQDKATKNESAIEGASVSTEVNSVAWTEEQMQTYLRQYRRYRHLHPGIVTRVDDEQAFVQLRGDEIAVLRWDDVKWARPYISDTEQGAEPKTIHDVVQEGQHIYVKRVTSERFVLSQLPEVSGALVALDPFDGAIHAIVGGYSFYMSQYNRASQAKRQVGSNIKPFIYSAALENNFTLASIINDAPINQWDKRQGIAWRPKNSPEKYEGPIRVRRALAQSKNVVSVRLLRGVGLQKTIDHLTKFGFAKADLPRNESLALGSASLTPLEVATGIATFANGGYLVEPYLIREVTDTDGDVIFRATPTVACDDCDMVNANEGELPQGIPAPRVISAQNAFLIAEAMKSTIQGGGSWKYKTAWVGTGWRARTLKRSDLSGKTGTTNDSKDTWFSGFTPNIVATTWVGFDNPDRALGKSRYNRNLSNKQVYGGEAGAKTAQPAWIGFLNVALQDIPQMAYRVPENIVSVRIDMDTGLLALRNDHTTRFEYFVRSTEPKQYAKEGSNPVIFNNDEDVLVTEEDDLFQ